MAVSAGLQLPYGINPTVPVSIDRNYGKSVANSGGLDQTYPYATVGEACTMILAAYRFTGKQVIINNGSGGSVIYAWETTDLSDAGLQPYFTSTKVTLSLGYTPIDQARLNVANGMAGLDSGGKLLYSQFPDAALGNVHYKGTYDGTVITSSDSAYNGLPLPTATSANAGVYFISTGTFTVNGFTFNVGDWLISDGAAGWSKVDNSDAITSFNSRIGAIVPIVGDYSAFYPRLDTPYTDPSWVSTLSWSKIITTPTTLAGYGITDAAPITGSNNYIQNSLITQTANFNITGNGTIIGNLAVNNITTPTDNTYSIGTSAKRFANVYAANGLFAAVTATTVTATQVIPTALQYNAPNYSPTGYSINSITINTNGDSVVKSANATQINTFLGIPTTYVPYTGATASVNLGVYALTATQLSTGLISAASAQLLNGIGSAPSTGIYLATASKALQIATPTGQINLGVTDGGGFTATFQAKNGTVALLSDVTASNPMSTLGDMTIGGAAGTPTRLAGNTLLSTLFLTSTGTGSAPTSQAYFDLFANGNTWTNTQTFNSPISSVNVNIVANGNPATTVATQRSSNSQTFGVSLWNGSAAVAQYNLLKANASTTVGLAHRQSLYIGSTTSSTNTGGVEIMSWFSSGNVAINGGGTDQNALLYVGGTENGVSGTNRGIYLNPTLQTTSNNENQYMVDIAGASSSVGGSSIRSLSIATAGSSLTNGTYTGVSLTGGTGSGATATVVIAGGVLTGAIAITAVGTGYTTGDVLTVPVASIGGTGVAPTLNTSVGYTGSATYSLRHAQGIIPTTANNVSLGTSTLYYVRVFTATTVTNGIQFLNGGFTFSSTSGQALGIIGNSTGNFNWGSGADNGYKLNVTGLANANGTFNSTGITQNTASNSVANLFTNTINPLVNNQTLIGADFNFTFGTGATGLTTGVISSGNYSVSVAPTSAGSVSVAQFSNSGAGSGASFTVVTTVGGVTSITVTNAGSGYAVGNTITLVANGGTVVYTVPSSGGVGLTGVTFWGVRSNSDLYITDSTKGVVLTSPNGTKWRVTIDNTGTLNRTSL